MTMSYEHLLARIVDHIVTSVESEGVDLTPDRIATTRSNVELMAGLVSLETSLSHPVFADLDDDETVRLAADGLTMALKAAIATGIVGNS